MFNKFFSTTLMKIFPRIFSLTLVLLLLSCMTASCAAGSVAKVPESKKLSLVCTSFPPFDLARSVAGDQAELTMLLKPGAESHTYEPTPQDIKKIAEADLFITVGGENDAWVDHLLESLGDKKPEIFKLVEAVDTVEEEQVEGMETEEEHAHDSSQEIDKEEVGHETDKREAEPAIDKGETANEHDEHEIDEHVWTAPKNFSLDRKSVV